MTRTSVQFPLMKSLKFRCSSFQTYLPKTTAAVTMNLIILLKFEIVTKTQTMKWNTDLSSQALSEALITASSYHFSHFLVFGQTAEFQYTI